MGLTTVLYIHLHALGESPHIGPTALLHCMSALVAFCVTLSMCVLVKLHSVKNGDGISSNTDGTDFPVPGEHADLSF